MQRQDIPNVIHFIFLQQRPAPFAFVHYLAIKSAYDCNRPEAIKFHYNHEPTGEWWEKAKPYLTLVPVEPPTEIFGNKLHHYAHQADVIRLEVLLREGGIYLDMDVVCINSFRPLLEHDCVMGREGWHGLCNAVILARPGARFIEIWYDQYRTFDSKRWNYHSVILPLQLYRKHPRDIHVEDRHAFFWPLHENPGPLWDEPEQRTTFSARMTHRMEAWILSQAYCVHLWNSKWREPYLSALSPESIRSSQNVFSRICRRYIAPSERTGIFSNNRWRGLLLLLIRLKSFLYRP